MNPLISIIMPAFNMEKYICEAIESVINQSYENWELIIVDNNSTDQTTELIKKYLKDTRIQLLHEENQGVSHARNKALQKIKGEYLCFLDSDDIWPPNSLSSRINIFLSHPEIDFVDGCVQYANTELKPIEKTYQPTFKGQPFDQLLALNSSCLFGNTWLIKLSAHQVYKFQTDMTHAEDLFFYLTIAKDKLYDYTSEIILKYRQRNDSAMTDLKGLENGYILLIKKIKNQFNVDWFKMTILKFKIAKIMSLSFLFDGRDIRAALLSPFKILLA